MSGRQSWRLLSLSLLIPAACQVWAGTTGPDRVIQGRSPDPIGAREFPIPEMVHLQGGTFRTQGDPGKGIKPGDYTLGDYWIGRHEVTFQQFDHFCADTGYYLKRYHGIDRPVDASTRTSIERAARGGGSVGSQDALRTVEGPLRDYPVVQVCWLDAVAYCLWLTEKTGIAFRLPTQVEWEYACTVGGSEPAPAGVAELDRVAWCGINAQPGVSQTQIHPVGRKQPNGAGIHDMYGNVWEWCLDGREESGHSQAIEDWSRTGRRLSPMDMNGGSSFLASVSSLFQGPKALRGGAWAEPSERVSLSYRMFYPMNYVAHRVGFRVLCTEDPSGVFPRSPGAVQNGARPVRQDTAESLADRRADLEQRRALLQAQIDELARQYRTLLGDVASAYPVVAWRDELQALQARYEDMLPYRKRTNAVRDGLPGAQRQDYFKLRTLCAWLHFADYTRDEEEYLLAFLTEPGRSTPLTGEAREERRARIALKETAARTELEKLLRSTALPSELIERAKTDGRMEARVNVLEAALRKVEPPAAVEIGYQLQTLRHQLQDLDDPKAFGGAALEDVIDSSLYENESQD